MLRLIFTGIILLLSQFSFGFETPAKHAVLIDYDTQTILFEKEAYEKMPPSSMSKLMTAYIAFESLKADQVKLEDTFPISEKAWKIGGSRMFIPLKAKVSFEDLLKGLVIQSGNDAAVAISEILMGSEEEFANKMNETAVKLGMKNSNFTNATGWPDDNNYSCTHDLAILAYHTIKDFPEYYKYYSEKEFTYNSIKQENRNGLLYRDIGADGLKTGHTEAGGFGLAASVKRGDRRLIAIVNGLKSNKERTSASEMLINYGIMSFSNVKVAHKNQVIEKIKVSNGKVKEITLVAATDIILTLSKSEAKQVKTKIHYHTPAIAPFKTGTHLGELIVEIPNHENKTYPLVAQHAVEKANFFEKIQHNFGSIFD